MPGIADIIMQQMATAGQPRIAKETSTLTTPGEGLDIGSIIMMLMMSQLFKGKGPPIPGIESAPMPDFGLMGMGGGGPMPGGGGLPGPMAGPGPDFGLMGGSSNVGMPTPPTDISAGIPLQAPQNLQDLMMIVDLLSKMDTNPYE